MEENLSGAFSYEQWRYEDEQETLRRDPAYHLWLDSIEKQRTEDYTDVIDCD